MGVKIKDVFDGEGLRRFSLRLIAGEAGLVKEVSTSRIQKPGLLLTGLLEELHPDRIQIFGAAEIGYLAGLSEEELQKGASSPGVPC